MSTNNNFWGMGRLTANPEMRETTSGVKCANFTVAISEKYNGETKTTFVPCKAWRNVGEQICKYFVKGKPIIIQGKFTVDRYEDKNGGKKSFTYINVSSFSFVLRDSTDNASPEVRTQRVEEDGFVQETFGEGWVETDDNSTFDDIPDIPF